MIHELLLAMYGIDGDIFIRMDNGALGIADNLPFVSPSEAAIMNRLCELGSFYKKLHDFAQQYSRPICGRDSGLYLSAFAFALTESLEVYRQALCLLEEELLKDPHISISYIQFRLEEFHLLFPAIWTIVDNIIRFKIRGCRILEVINKNIPFGLIQVRTCLLTIQRSCHRVLFRQLSAWILRGMLIDRYSEFFIQEVPREESTENEINSEDETEPPLIDNLTKRQMDNLTRPAGSFSSKNRFSLRPDMLPDYISVHLAKQILFIGESVNLFDSDPIHAGHVSRNAGVNTLINELESEYASQLFQLGEERDFSLIKLQILIEKVRNFITSRLWVLLVTEHDLIQHLRLVKEIYLFGRGELFLTFVDMVRPSMLQAPTSSTEHDVNAIFQKAARAILLDDTSLADQFKFVIGNATAMPTDIEEDHLQPLECGWDYLSIKYNVRWPFHILFPPSVLEKYGQLFKFLLAVRRTQLALQSSFALQMLHKGRNQMNVLSSRQWLLRNHMSFLIDNLQYYLQVDVIESQFSILIKSIMETKDVERIQTAHHTFITNLLGQAFLYNKPIYNCLMKILGVCLAFTDVVERDLDPDRASEIDAKLQSIQRTFSGLSTLLFNILSNVINQLQTSPHLAQLLLRLDFNKYYSSTGGKLGQRI